MRAEVLALRRQVQVLERQIKRVRWTPGDRLALAALTRLLPKASWPGLLVKPETVLGWHGELVRRRWAAWGQRRPKGRPPLPEDLRGLIVRMAKENPTWGYFRIRGELLKLGHRVAATTIRSVLIRSRVPPAGRRGGLSWKSFLAAHAQSLIATDAVLAAEGAEVIVTPLLAPTANAHSERWVGSLRRECLDWLVILSERHLAAVLREYLAHYNDERPHRSCGLRAPTARGDPGPPRTDAVQRKVRLGGLLSDYRYEPTAA